MKYFYFTLITFILSTSNLVAQTGIFKSLKDYQEKNLSPMDTLVVKQATVMSSATITTFIFYKDQQKIKYKPNEIWGFLFNGHLFRCGNTDFYYIKQSGKVVLYANGWAAYEQLEKNRDYGTIYSKTFYSISNDLNSLIYDMPWGPSQKHKPTLTQLVNYTNFTKRYPEHVTLYECIDKTWDINVAEFCIDQYNERAK